MTNNDETLDAILRRDPLGEAEKITGLSYKDDEETSALGMLMHMAMSEEKRQALTARGDTHYASTLEEQIAVMEGQGFETVLVDPFESRNGEAEAYFVMWHPEGVLATVESFHGTRRNSCVYYYNMRFTPENMVRRFSINQSGHLFAYGEDPENDTVWVGHLDGREGFVHTFNRLRSMGEFLPKWIERPFLWLVNYRETDVDGYDFRAINEERIARLPQYVRDAITPEGEDNNDF